MSTQPKAKHLRLVESPTSLGSLSEPSDNSDFINPNDFKSIVLKVDLVNSTTKTEIRDGKRIYGIDAAKTQKGEDDKDLSMIIEEYAEKGMTLEIPSHVCASGHAIVISVTTENAPTEISFSASAKVEAVEKLASGRERVRIAFGQYDEKAWNSLMGLYAQRQQEILAFFKAVKDY